MALRVSAGSCIKGDKSARLCIDFILVFVILGYKTPWVHLPAHGVLSELIAVFFPQLIPGKVCRKDYCSGYEYERTVDIPGLMITAGHIHDAASGERTHRHANYIEDCHSTKN